jgi:mRNA interferase HigB
MRVISKKALREFWQQNTDAEQSLGRWFEIANRAAWHNLAETKADCPSAEAVGTCTVFNVGGNKYRLITYINYRFQRIYILHVLAHKEYDLEKWKKDCDC